MSDSITIQEASIIATEYTKKHVSTSNISYLITYGRIRKIGENGSTRISKKELLEYYDNYHTPQEEFWKDKLGDDLNWKLSFSDYKEKETTKHVHRLHPYKGKFIPQLVEYFLDSNIDQFKSEVFFEPGDIVLDPFCGSGTCLVQANELGINGIGIDVSQFNAMISNTKLSNVNLIQLTRELDKITLTLKDFISKKNTLDFEKELLAELKIFNDISFKVPDYKYQVRQKDFNEKEYSTKKVKEFQPIFDKLVEKYNIKLKHKNPQNFIETWFLQVIIDEIQFIKNKIFLIEDESIRNIITIILSRTIRSCRATTHSDLATLLEPVSSTYYCSKHYKICKPIFNILSWWDRYSKDTVKRLSDFSKLRTNTEQVCFIGDSRSLNIEDKLSEINHSLLNIYLKRKIKGIFSSPPYVGVIDYHEQHAYAYDLFNFERNDEKEIGPLFKGQGKAAKLSYIEGIASVLNNAKNFLCEDYNIFLVANDKHNLYPEIAKKAGMMIVNQFKRPVLNRTEKDKNAYSEIIFQLKRQLNEKTS